MSLTLILPPRVTDRAFARLSEICTLSGQTKALRVAVEGGGVLAFNMKSPLMIRRPMTLFWKKTVKKC